MSPGAKVGADDFLAAGDALGDIVALATTELRRPSTLMGVFIPPNERATVQYPPPLAYAPDILARFERDIRRVGHVGEKRVTKLIYLAVTSRLLTKVVSCAMKGPPAAGKERGR
jgi:hypothetical protein